MDKRGFSRTRRTSFVQLSSTMDNGLLIPLKVNSFHREINVSSEVGYNNCLGDTWIVCLQYNSQSFSQNPRRFWPHYLLSISSEFIFRTATRSFSSPLCSPGASDDQIEFLCQHWIHPGGVALTLMAWHCGSGEWAARRELTRTFRQENFTAMWIRGLNVPALIHLPSPSLKAARGR